MNQGIIIGNWSDAIGLNVIAEYPTGFRKDQSIEDPKLLNIFNERIVQENPGLEIIEEEECKIATYYTPFIKEKYEETESKNHGIVFLFLNKEKEINILREQFIEFSIFILKLMHSNDFPELFFNIIDNFAFLEPLTEEQRYAAIYTNPVREEILEKLGSGGCSRTELEAFIKEKSDLNVFDFQGLIMPFIRAGLVKHTIEHLKKKKKEPYYFLIRDVYLFRIPPKQILEGYKKGKFKLFKKLDIDYQMEVEAFFEEYELGPSEINKISLLLAIPNIYKIILLLRECPYELDEFRIDYLDRFNYLPSNFNYLLKLLERNDIVNIYRKNENKILVLKSDIQFQVFFPEYLVDNIRRGWRENIIDKHIAVKHLTFLRDEYLENFMKFSSDPKGDIIGKPSIITEEDITTSSRSNKKIFNKKIENIFSKA